MNPYFLMTLLYAGLALLMAIDSSLTSFNIVSAISGLRWLRVHFVTLGLLTQMIFGFVPIVVAAYTNQPKPKTRWDIWLSLNAGILLLLIAIPLVNQILILTGGTLIFTATTLLILEINGLRATSNRPATIMQGRNFYIAGLGYLLIGVIVGTGLWLGWGKALHIAVPIEVHIHANNWGFMALVFAGLLIDLYPGFSGKPISRPQAIKPIFWLLTIGAFGLVLGPWLKSELFTVPGILMYLAGNLWLLSILFVPLLKDRTRWTSGMWHLLSAHAWILAPVLVAPLILLKVPGFPGAGVEQNAPQALIYGWVLQFGYAIIPYVLMRLLRPRQSAQLGGSWLSLITVHIGGVLLWMSIFIKQYEGMLHGSAYLFWTISLIPFVMQVWRIVTHDDGDVEPATTEIPLNHAVVQQ